MTGTEALTHPEYWFREFQRCPGLLSLLFEPHPAASQRPFLVLVYPDDVAHLPPVFTQQPSQDLHSAALLSLSPLFSLNRLPFSGSPQVGSFLELSHPGHLLWLHADSWCPESLLLFCNLALPAPPPSALRTPSILPCCRHAYGRYKFWSCNLRFGGEGGFHPWAFKKQLPSAGTG